MESVINFVQLMNGEFMVMHLSVLNATESILGHFLNRLSERNSTFSPMVTVCNCVHPANGAVLARQF